MVVICICNYLLVRGHPDIAVSHIFLLDPCRDMFGIPFYQMSFSKNRFLAYFPSCLTENGADAMAEALPKSEKITFTY
ncbi:MAG: hypothetical protein HDR53_04005 [Treponema sp.]|nr:hypothetical protein [Treponema sp.]